MAKVTINGLGRTPISDAARRVDSCKPSIGACQN